MRTILAIIFITFSVSTVKAETTKRIPVDDVRKKLFVIVALHIGKILDDRIPTAYLAMKKYDLDPNDEPGGDIYTFDSLADCEEKLLLGLKINQSTARRASIIPKHTTISLVLEFENKELSYHCEEIKPLS